MENARVIEIHQELNAARKLNAELLEALKLMVREFPRVNGGKFNFGRELAIATAERAVRKAVSK